MRDFAQEAQEWRADFQYAQSAELDVLFAEAKTAVRLFYTRRAEARSMPDGAPEGKAGPFTCHSRRALEIQGEWKLVPCGECPGCRRAKKHDMTSRLAAEAITADHVDFVTLTFEDRFGKAFAAEIDRSLVPKFMKKLRNKVEQIDAEIAGLSVREFRRAVREGTAKRTRVRHFVALERGEKRGRVHLHALLFYYGPARPLKRTEPNPRFNGARMEFMPDLWAHDVAATKDGSQIMRVPLGGVRVDPLSRVDMVRTIRYVAAYATKSIQGTGPKPEVWRSSSPGIGAMYIVGEAQRYAEHGLPLPRAIMLYGYFDTRGKHAGKHQRFVVNGRMRVHYVRSYYQTWAQVHPHRETPYEKWHDCWAGDGTMLLRGEDDPFGLDLCGPIAPRPRSHQRLNAYGTQRRPTAKQLAERRKALMPPRARPRRFLPIFDSHSGKIVAQIELSRFGRASVYIFQTGRVEPIFDDARGVLECSEEQHQKIAAWITEKRGPDWVPREVYLARKREALARKVNGIVRLASAPGMAGGALARHLQYSITSDRAILGEPDGPSHAERWKRYVARRATLVAPSDGFMLRHTFGPP